MKRITPVLVLVTVFAVSACFTGCGAKDSGVSTTPTVAIEPDAAYTGDDCSNGGKSSDGSGMTSACSKKKITGITVTEYAPGEVLVKFREGITEQRAVNIMNSLGGSSVKKLYSPKGDNKLLKKVKIENDLSVEEAVKAYSSHSDVLYAEPNYKYRALTTTSSDPSYGQCWGLHNTGQTVNGTSGTSGYDIKAEDAWDKLTECSSVIVAVVDTGVNYNNRDLSSNMWDGGTSYPNHGWDYADGDNNPVDMNGHGTHCAGIIGADGSNGVGLSGVCWKVKLMAVRVLDAVGSGYLSDVADGIEFAADNGAHVISLSLGGPGSTTLENAIAYARTKGVIIVAAAGNSATSSITYAYPAAYNTNPTYDHIIAVAAIDQSGALADFSNYGTWVNIAAPGVNILSTWPGQSVVTREDLSKWYKDSNWGINSVSYGSTIEMLTNPASGFKTRTYANNQNSIIYQGFDLNSYSPGAVTAGFYADIYTEAGTYDNDRLYISINYAGRKPSYASDGLWYWSGNYGLDYYELDLTPALSYDVIIGFTMVTNSSIAYYGAGIGPFDVTRLYYNTTACMFLDGTSMAAPHVTGVVAMAIQEYMNRHGGSYTKTSNYLSIINAVYSGATTDTKLDISQVASQRLVNAYGALTAVDALP